MQSLYRNIRYGLVCLSASLAFGLAGCGDSDDVALRVDGVTFAEDELAGFTTERREHLVEVTSLGLAFARDEAEELGDPLLERRREDLLLERLRADVALEAAGIEEDVLRARYETDPHHELVVRHVVALAEEEAPDSAQRRARQVAERALERVESGEDFAAVAADLSEEPGAAERGGQLEPGRRGSWVPEFWRAADALEEGERTEVVRTPYGDHVLRLEERRTVPYEEVRSDVVLEAGRMVGGMEESWEAWSDSVADEIGGGAAGEPEAAAEAPSEEIRLHALEEARERGLDVPAGEQDRLLREWENQVASWATSLGFEPDASPTAVKEQALEALATTRQNARIALSEMEAHRNMLRSAYEVDGLEGR